MPVAAIFRLLYDYDDEDRTRLVRSPSRWLLCTLAYAPKFTRGRALDLSGVTWSDFKRLRAIRDDLAIHPKHSGFTMTYAQLADAINRFRSGIAQFQIEMHHAFRARVPSKIIRIASAPDVELVASTR